MPAVISLTTAVKIGGVVVVEGWGSAVRVGAVVDVVLEGDRATVGLGAITGRPLVDVVATIAVDVAGVADPVSEPPHEVTTIAAMTAMRCDFGTSPWCRVNAVVRSRREVLVRARKSLKLALVCAR